MEYQKPDVEIISLLAQEEITNDDVIGGEPGVESSWDW